MASYERTRVINKTTDTILDSSLFVLDKARMIFGNFFGRLALAYAGFTLTGAAIDKIDPPKPAVISAEPILPSQSAAQFNAIAMKIDEIAIKANNGLLQSAALCQEVNRLLSTLLFDKSLSEKQAMALSASFEHKVTKFENFAFAEDVTTKGFAHRDECLIETSQGYQGDVKACMADRQDPSRLGNFNDFALHAVGTAGFMMGSIVLMNAAGMVRKKRLAEKSRPKN
jgi:hypothetical protein